MKRNIKTRNNIFNLKVFKKEEENRRLSINLEPGILIFLLCVSSFFNLILCPRVSRPSISKSMQHSGQSGADFRRVYSKMDPQKLIEIVADPNTSGSKKRTNDEKLVGSGKDSKFTEKRDYCN
jgi:hypothetical protein